MGKFLIYGKFLMFFFIFHEKLDTLGAPSARMGEIAGIDGIDGMKKRGNRGGVGVA